MFDVLSFEESLAMDLMWDHLTEDHRKKFKEEMMREEPEKWAAFEECRISRCGSMDTYKYDD